MMRNMFAAKPLQDQSTSHPEAASDMAPENPIIFPHVPDWTGYLSDLSSDDDECSDADSDDARTESKSDAEESCEPQLSGHTASRPNRIPAVPPRKRQKLAIPRRVQRKEKRDERNKELRNAYDEIVKLLKSKKTKFVSGPQGLQARRSRAIEIHLRLFLENKKSFIEASERAAESQGFASHWGGRQLRSWTRSWINKRELPISLKGRHAKAYSLLSDPAIATDLRAYVRSNKWAMNPEKLSQFTQKELIPPVAEKYLNEIVHDEMPRGLKKYIELELFPRIHMKVGRGISLPTARRWLHREGFRYISHKKGLYFDGHDRADVVDYRQNGFLPKMKALEPRLVKYVVGDVEKEQYVPPQNYVKRRLVLCAHDEMTAQAHDGKEKSWVLEDQHMLRKKGVGRGIHKSDVICSTIGWLKGASQTLEYGKNYEGYWTGELFVKQVSEFCETLSQYISD
jgi:hypothetical protein